MTNADDQPTTPAVPPVPPVAPTEPSPYTPAPQGDASAFPAPPAHPATPAAPPPYQPAAPQNAYAQNPYTPGETAPPRGLAIASMIAGIAGIALAFVAFGFLPAVAGVVLGHIAQRKQPYARPFWLTGIITGYVGVAIGLITGVFWILVVIAAISGGSSVYS